MEYNHYHLIRSSGATALDGLPSFRFAAIPDGLPLVDDDTTQDAWLLCESIPKNCLAPFRDLLSELKMSKGVPPVSCVVSDGVMSFTLEVVKELGVPNVLFWTTSACGFLAYAYYCHLVEKGFIPLKVLRTLSCLCALHLGAIGLSSDGQVFIGTNLEFLGIPLHHFVHRGSRFTYLAVSDAPAATVASSSRSSAMPRISKKKISITSSQKKNPIFKPLSLKLPGPFGPNDLLDEGTPLLFEIQDTGLGWSDVEGGITVLYRSLKLAEFGPAGGSVAEQDRVIGVVVESFPAGMTDRTKELSAVFDFKTGTFCESFICFLVPMELQQGLGFQSKYLSQKIGKDVSETVELVANDMDAYPKLCMILQHEMIFPEKCSQKKVTTVPAYGSIRIASLHSKTASRSLPKAVNAALLLLLYEALFRSMEIAASYKAKASAKFPFLPRRFLSCSPWEVIKNIVHYIPHPTLLPNVAQISKKHHITGGSSNQRLAMILSTCFCDCSDETLGDSRNAASSEPPRRLFEFGVLGTRGILLLTFAVGSEPVEVALLGHMLRRPKTAFNKPHPDFRSGELSPTSVMTLLKGRGEYTLLQLYEQIEMVYFGNGMDQTPCIGILCRKSLIKHTFFV
ncbi:hypothetical protein RJ639_000976 [Escallonia herrerae]|uniref:Uncharacterized protein n=1 Tax=Escallonia herrerae TaxID=1293975 RepID=A0AA88XB15_9ASTE|nr:hypothetical protein RJ639_000976 [Escallonia herrerae]